MMDKQPEGRSRDIPKAEDILPPELDPETRELLKAVVKRQLDGITFSMILLGTEPSPKDTDSALEHLQGEVDALEALTDELDLDLRRKQR